MKTLCDSKYRGAIIRNSASTAFVHLSRSFCIPLLSALLSLSAYAQPRISLHIQHLAFRGNLLKCADGTLVAERGDGELHRLTATGAYDRKLDFDPTHPAAA